MNHSQNASQTFTVLSSETVFSGRLTVVRERLLKPDGGETDYTFVSTHGAAAVLAFADADHIVLTRQYRHPIGRVLLDIPGGGILPGEIPEAAACRELQEETGFTARNLEPLGRFYPAPGTVRSQLHVFVTHDIEPGETSPDDDEDIEAVILPWGNVVDQVLAGEGVDGSLAFAVMLYELRKSHK